MTNNLLHRILARRKRSRLNKLLANQFESLELRKYFKDNHSITVGLYSYGCFDANRIGKYTDIGRYCSFAPTAYVFNANHGITYISSHPYLYNPSLGIVGEEKIERRQCKIEDDVWVGHAAIILPSVKVVGRGAIIAAGAVVTKDVPPYAIVAGNPAKVIRHRFDEITISKIEATKWWLLDKKQIAKLMETSAELVYNPALFFADSDNS
ncbi:MAG: hypothetical protein RIQ60_2295 [Pseudomonadota bacterium]